MSISGWKVTFAWSGMVGSAGFDALLFLFDAFGGSSLILSFGLDLSLRSASSGTEGATRVEVVEDSALDEPSPEFADSVLDEAVSRSDVSVRCFLRGRLSELSVRGSVIVRVWSRRN